MKISEFIVRLEKAKEKHGDVEIMIDRDFFYDELKESYTGDDNYYWSVHTDIQGREYMLL